MRLPLKASSPGYLVMGEAVAAREELGVEAEEGPPRWVGLEPVGPGQRVVHPHSVLQGLPWPGPLPPWTPGRERLVPGGIGAGRPLPSP